MSDHKNCSAGGVHEFPTNPNMNQVVKCPECGHMYAWFGFWVEIC